MIVSYQRGSDFDFITILKGDATITSPSSYLDIKIDAIFIGTDKQRSFYGSESDAVEYIKDKLNEL